jgi:hypothetical protein
MRWYNGVVMGTERQFAKVVFEITVVEEVMAVINCS